MQVDLSFVSDTLVSLVGSVSFGTAVSNTLQSVPGSVCLRCTARRVGKDPDQHLALAGGTAVQVTFLGISVDMHLWAGRGRDLDVWRGSRAGLEEATGSQ